MKKYAFAGIAVLLFAASCDPERKMVDATVIDSGDITNEGCGYVLQLADQALIQPVYLPSAYQHGGIRVKVEYQHTGIADTCDFGTVIYDLVDIKRIKINMER